MFTARNRLFACALLPAVACDPMGTAKPTVVEAPADGMYAGSLTIEKRSYVAGIRVDTRSCSTPVLLTVRGATEEWFQMAEASCDLAGLSGDASVRLATVPGATPTGSPMGTVEGSVPEMMWSGAFWSDGAFEATAEAVVDDGGTGAEWTLDVSAVSLDSLRDSGDSGDSGL